MPIAASSLVSALVAPALGPAVEWLVSQATPPKKPDAIDAATWARIIETSGAGRWIGHLERLVFVGALWTSNETLIAAWLAFKLASKWEVWRNVIHVPDQLAPLSAVEWFATRSSFGSWMLSKFWLGTLANVLAAFVAIAVGRALGGGVYFGF